MCESFFKFNIIFLSLIISFSMAYYKMNSFVAKVKFFRDRSKYSEPAKQGMIKLFYTNKDASDDTKIIKERTEEFDRSKLFKSDVSTYGVCSVLAGEHLQLGNMKEAEKMAQNAIEAAAHTKQQDNIYEAYAEGILGEVLYAQSNYKESAEHFHKALKAYEHHTRSSTGPESLMLVAATQLISWLSLSKNDTLNSQSYCRTALSMTERLLGPDHPDTGNCMFNLATANMKAGDISKGTEGLLNRSLQIYQSDSIKANDISLHKDSRRNALHLLSLMYTEREDFGKAIESLNQIIDMFNAGIIDGIDAVDEFKTLADIYSLKNDKLRAEKFYRQALYYLEKDNRFNEVHPRVLALNQLIIESTKNEH